MKLKTKSIKKEQKKPRPTWMKSNSQSTKC